MIAIMNLMIVVELWVILAIIGFLNYPSMIWVKHFGVWQYRSKVRLSHWKPDSLRSSPFDCHSVSRQTDDGFVIVRVQSHAWSDDDPYWYVTQRDWIQGSVTCQEKFLNRKDALNFADQLAKRMGYELARY